MRRPTPLSEQLADWRIMVANNERPHDEWPRCGWFKQRQARGSKTWLPARIWLHQTVDFQTGELMEPERHVLEVAGRIWTDEMEVAHRWLFLRPVNLDEYRWLTARLALHSHGIVRQVSTFA